MKFLSFAAKRFREFFSFSNPSGQSEARSDSSFSREKTIAFGLALFFAICLWFIVNLSGDYNVTVEVPIQLVNFPEGLALVNDIPEHVAVSLTGEGWRLIGLSNNPPKINLSVESEARQVNLFEQARNQISSFADLNIVDVEPRIVNIETEEKVSKKIPVEIVIGDLDFRDHFGLIDNPFVRPDSITVTGARSKLADLTAWETTPLRLNGIDRSMQTNLPLSPSESNIIVAPTSVTVHLSVAEFTEAEVRIPVRTRNLPPGEAVTYNPSSITVKFDVPIEQYSEVQGTRPFAAYVDYAMLEDDTTGRIAPQIEKTSSDFNVRLRSFQPSRVSYFRVLSD